jgi:hypothetical protein
LKDGLIEGGVLDIYTVETPVGLLKATVVLFFAHAIKRSWAQPPHGRIDTKNESIK